MGSPYVPLSAVCVSVCLLGISVSPTKADEPIKVPFGAWTRTTDAECKPVYSMQNEDSNAADR